MDRALHRTDNGSGRPGPGAGLRTFLWRDVPPPRAGDRGSRPPAASSQPQPAREPARSLGIVCLHYGNMGCGSGRPLPFPDRPPPPAPGRLHRTVLPSASFLSLVSARYSTKPCWIDLPSRMGRALAVCVDSAHSVLWLEKQLALCIQTLTYLG
jgi:hypothetical protein